MATALQLRQQFLDGERNLGEYYHELLNRCEDVNHRLNCLNVVTSELAEATVAQLHSKLTSGRPKGKLFGLPIIVKDNICLKDHPTTCASRILNGFVPPYNATVIDRLLADDAVIIAKANMDEFAMGSSNENSALGLARNPRDLERAPGGSSGGSAAAVAAGLVPLALGSDTGGSVRQPAAFCGVVGLKPTYGAVSRYGLVAFASSLDQIGPLAADVHSAALLFDVIAGHDSRDSTSAQQSLAGAEENLKAGVRGLKIGLPREYFAAGLDAEIAAAITRVADWLKREGAEIREVALPHTKYAVAAYYVVADAEASSNLARYDGVRYGQRAAAHDLLSMYTETRHAGFGAEVKRRIMLGTYVLSSGYYDAYYAKAMKVRRVIMQEMLEALNAVDLLLTPTTPTTAFKLGEKTEDPLAMYLSDIYTVSANLAGLPAISVPCGVDAAKLPIGAQLIGRPFDEPTLFRAAAVIEASSR
ncbi:MAG: Asp-tRNA(Asn)/Glu-tRNA(Gln) amidotransferase subunit GatA [candidate division Zixibacteria bacterium]|nr:Asp-tRNA(Asn)/Glu-tRNA(Gln) amidotransferase subunit GatA [candidate division Zixibacteria bacterium]